MTDLDKLRKAFDGAGLDKIFREFEFFARNSIVVEIDEKFENGELGVSRFGGCLDLPSDMEWFKNPKTGQDLSFIGQINLAQVKEYDLADELPNSGMLYFFYDLEEGPWGFDPKDKGASRVYFYQGPMNKLESCSTPDNTVSYPSYKISFSNRIDIPEYSSQIIVTDLTDDEYETYLGLVEELALMVDNKLLGHSNNIQNGQELQCELIRQGLYCGTHLVYQDPRVPELSLKRFDWQLLLQVASNEKTEMAWGDEGNLYFWIRKEDLAKRNFEDAWCILQSY